MAIAVEAPLGHHPVEPAGIDLARRHLRAIQQVEEERAVGRAALDQHDGVGQRPAQSGAGLVAGRPPGDDLGDHRVVLGRDHVALRHTGVDPDPGAGRPAQDVDRARGRREAALGVLGVEPRLDGVAPRLGWRPVEAAAGGHVELQLHQVGTGGQLGDGVLDLQARVDLEKGEAALSRLVEELDRAGVAVAGHLCQAHRGFAQLALLVGAERHRARLLEHLLVAPLHAAVAHTQRPGGAVLVRHHLHLDVVGAADQPFEEHGAVAEGLGALGPRALEGGRQVLRRVHHADAPATAPRCGLDHQRKADRRDAARPPPPPSRPGRHSRGRGARRPAPPAAWRRSCRRGGASRRRRGRRRRRRDGHTARRTPAARPRTPSPPRPPRRGCAASARSSAARSRYASASVLSNTTTSSASRAKRARRSASVATAMARSGVALALEVQLPDGVDGPHRGLTPVDDGHSAEVPAHALPPPATSPVERWSTGADRRTARRRMLRPSPGAGQPAVRRGRRRRGWRPRVSRRFGARRPVRSAMISAQIDTAVSSGVRAPMSRPMGAITRSRSAGSTPSSSSRRLRSSVVRRLPMAPR